MQTISTWRVLPPTVRVLPILCAATALSLFVATSTPLTAGLNGTYTIGGANPSYPTLDSAVATLKRDTLTGPVTWLIRSGEYTPAGFLTIANRPGMSEVNTLTIRPDVGATVTITGSYAGSGIIRLSGCNHVIIDGSNTEGGTTQDLTIFNTSTATSSAMLLEAGADFNVIRNCRLMCLSTSASVSAGAVVNISYGGNDSNAVEYCTIGDPDGVHRASYALYLSGAPATPNRGNRIVDNDIVNWGHGGATPLAGYAMYVGLSTYGTLIARNRLHKTTGATGGTDFVFYLTEGGAGSRNTRIEGNQVYSLVPGVGGGSRSTAVVYYVAGGADSTHFQFVNNMITHDQTNVTWSGLYFLTVNATANCRFDICNNSIMVAGEAGGTLPVNYVLSLFAKSGAAEPAAVFNHYNNIYDCNRAFITTVLLINGLSTMWHSDNNIFNLTSSGGSYAVQYTSSLYRDADVPDFDAYRQNTKSDSNSFSTPVPFALYQQGDLHIVDSCTPFTGEGRGRYLDFVTEDFDGELRDSAKPDMGADEGTFNADGIRIVAPSVDTTVAPGSQMTFRFTTTRQMDVRVEYMAFGTGAWLGVGTVPGSNPLPAVNEFTFDVPAVPGERGFLRIANVDYSCEQSTTPAIRIEVPQRDSIVVVRPNGGEVWNNNDVVAVNWRAASRVQSVSIDLSTDGGATWVEIGRDIASVGGALNEYPWTVALLPAESRSCLMRVRNFSDSIQLDISDAYFWILTWFPDAVPVNRDTYALHLFGAYPNPFMEGAEIRWSQEGAGEVVLRVYSTSGELVRTEEIGYREAGEQTAMFHATDLPAGTYFYELQRADEVVRGWMGVESRK